MNELNIVHFKDNRNMSEIADNSVHLIITSPPYFHIKEYAKDPKQKGKRTEKHDAQIGDIRDYEQYQNEMLKVWKECERVLVPNGKLVINVPLVPMTRKDNNTHHTRHIYDLNSDIQQKILNNTKMYLMDTYIWNRLNSQKKLMFGSYPYPRNFYAQNTIEFITVYVKDGKPIAATPEQKEKSKLTQKEWVELTKQIWDICPPNKSDLGWALHPAIMPEEIPRRLIKLYSFHGDTVLDPFAGSGTTLKVAKELGRNYIGYELMSIFKEVIGLKCGRA